MTWNLVLQGADIATPELKSLHGLSRAVAIERVDGVAHQAFRLTGADPATREAVAARADALGIDAAFVAAGRRLADLGLIAMDMDSTLITIECIDEIADFAGVKDRVAAVTGAAMRGEIDWPESLRQRVALLAGLDAAVLAKVYDERLRLSPGARALVAAAKRHGIMLLLVSGGFTYFTERLTAELALDYACSNTLEIVDGKLTGRVLGALCDADAKAAHLARVATSLGLARERVLAIGDGANDLKMLKAAGLSVAYQAKPVVRAEADVALNHVGLDGVLALFV